MAIMFRFQCCLTFTKRFKQKDSVVNTTVITAVTKSSIKPRSSATANRHLHSSEEKNGEQSRTKVNFDRTMMQAM